jgi:hypothetical protein
VSHRIIQVHLTSAQYEALSSAVSYTATTMEMDGPSSIGLSPHTPRSLDAGWRAVSAAWNRAGDGF